MSDEPYENSGYTLDDEVKGDLVILGNPNDIISGREKDSLVIRCLKGLLELHTRHSLKGLLELHNGHSESLSCITKVVNESYPSYSAADVHNCLVSAFPDLQAQQSNNEEEIYYLGIRYINAQSTEYKVTNWLRHRFIADEFGSISFRTLLDIAKKEIGFVKHTVFGHYVKKAFPYVYTRRSDRLRWYCGISLPEKELTVEERKKKVWLDSASKWLRENMIENVHGKEKCSVVFAALVQFVGKVSIDNCMAAVKCVFPNIPRKTVERNAFYIGIAFSQTSIREQIKHTPTKQRGVMSMARPIVSEEEKLVVQWLQNVINVNERHREKLRDLTNMLRKKTEQNLTEKNCLNYIRKAFPEVSYRKRDGIAQITGIEIKISYKPRDPWMEKAVIWVKEIVMQRAPTHYEKLGPILEVLKKGLQCLNHLKLCHVLRIAFPQCSIKKTFEGKLVYGVSLIDNYRNVTMPLFSDQDFMGDFSCVELNDVSTCDETELTNHELYIDVGESSHSKDNQQNDKFEGIVKKLEEKMDKMASTIEQTNKTVRRLQEDLSASNRQKDTLIVQMQQTLLLLSQQQFQRIVKPAEPLIPNQDGSFINLQALQTIPHTDINKATTLG